MKRKRHSPEQIVAKLREADAMLAGGATHRPGLPEVGGGEATFHRWREQYGGMKASEAKRLKELEQENARLKKLVADLALDNAHAQGDRPGKLLSPARRRRAVEHLQEQCEASQRRACRVSGAAAFDPAVYPAGQAG